VLVYTLPPAHITSYEKSLQIESQVIESFTDSIAHLHKIPAKAEDFRAVKFVRLA